MAEYFVRGPSTPVNNGEQFSDKTANVDLSSASFTQAADSTDPLARIRCCRAFVPAADGTLVYQAMSDTADKKIVVKAGGVYSVAIKSINRTGTSSALQIADAVTLLY
jgi:hypothetical protein